MPTHILLTPIAQARWPNLHDKSNHELKHDFIRVSQFTAKSLTLKKTTVVSKDDERLPAYEPLIIPEVYIPLEKSSTERKTYFQISN